MKFMNILVSIVILTSVCAAPLRDVIDGAVVPHLGGKYETKTNKRRSRDENMQRKNCKRLKFAPASCSASPIAPAPVKPDIPSPEQIAAFAPDLGFHAGVNPTGTGDCDGAVNGQDGKPLKVPCQCPPSRKEFIKLLQDNVAAGRCTKNSDVPVVFPTDDSKRSRLDRIQAAVVTLQNIEGPGKGCPGSSTTLGAQRDKIAAEPDTTATPNTLPTASSSTPVPVQTSPTIKPANPDAPTPEQVVSLAPDLGFTSGRNPTGTGDCDGAVNGPDGKPLKVPCQCPPSRETFISLLQENVAAGHAVHNPDVAIIFPTDDSKRSRLDRIQAAVVTLQNIVGPGKGCPGSSTTLGAQRDKIAAETDDPAPPPPAPAPSPPGQSGLVTPEQVAALAPDLGFTAGRNPSTSGDCDGAVNGADGKPVKVPCSCPPSREQFISLLQGDVAAGHAVRNPDVRVSFPSDDSTQAKLDRIQAAIVTLQNIDGPGKGCPAASTTLVAQRNALTKTS